MAPAIMGVPDRPDLGQELTASFCRNDPDIAAHFAQVTFLSDHRNDMALSVTPTLILQCSDDLIAPRQVGDFMQARMAGSVLKLIDNVGHCPHMSAPVACAAAMDEFFRKLAIGGA
jgi:sigma-B regulation protein RsbQ